MEVKLRDETKNNEELNETRNNCRRRIAEALVKNSKPYRNLIKMLRAEALKVKNKMQEKYDTKINHLRDKYRDAEEDLIDQVPKGLEQFAMLSVFNRGKFEEIKTDKYNVTIIGDVHLSADEEAA